METSPQNPLQPQDGSPAQSLSGASLPRDVRQEARWTGLREVMVMSWPIIMGSLSFTIMQFVDQMMVAKLGTDEFAAVGPAGLWTFTFSTFVLGTVGCVSTFAAQSLGRGRKEDCGRYAWQGIHISLATVLFVFILWPLSRPLFEVMDNSPRVTEMEIVYFRIRLFGYVFMAWQGALAAFFQAVGRPSIPMWAGVAANVVNIGLDWVLIFGKLGFPAYGIGGAAAATVIAQVVQVALLQGAFLMRSLDREYGTRTTYGLDPVKIRELFRIGWPAGFTMFLDIFNWALFTSIIIGRFGPVQLASHNVAINFMSVSFMPVVGLHHAIAPIVGQYIGRSDIPRAKSRSYTALRLGAIYMLTVGLIMALFGKPLISLAFTSDPEVVRIGHYLLILAAMFQGFDAVNIVMSGALRGVGDTRWMAVTTFVGAYLGFLPLAWLLAYWMDWGAVGAWIGATIYIIGLSGVLFARFHGERWRHIRIFESDRIVAQTE